MKRKQKTDVGAFCCVFWFSVPQTHTPTSPFLNKYIPRSVAEVFDHGQLLYPCGFSHLFHRFEYLG